MSNEATNEPLAHLRPEIWAAVQPAWEAGLIEHALFDAFKRVEALVQTRVGSPAIGSTLIERAFSATSRPPRIDISTNPLDIQRLVEVFRGSLGLFKGSRSHGGEEPSIPAAEDREYALRLLVWASVLVDLLDRDVSLAPQLLGRPQLGDALLNVWAERIGPSARVLVDGTVAPVVSRVGNFLQVSLEGIQPGGHRVLLEDGGHRGRPESFTLPPTPPAGNWHRVLSRDLPIFADEGCTQLRPERAILLESLEGGHRFRRVFPSASPAEPGDYASWEWSTDSPGVGESWVRIDGVSYRAWTSSMRFSGRGTRPAHGPEVSRLDARPSALQLRPGGLLPLRVLGHMSDGVGVWKVDVSDRATFAVDDESVAHVDRCGVVRAKRSGSCRVLVDGLDMHTEVAVIVGAHPMGTMVEYVGGIDHPRGIAVRGEELLIVDYSDTVWLASDTTRLRPLTSVPLTYLATGGLTDVLVSSARNVAVRDMSSRRFVILPASDVSRSIALELPDISLTPMAGAWYGESLLVADHAGGIWIFGEPGGIGDSAIAQFLWKAPSNPTGVAVFEDRLFLLTGADRRALYDIDLSSGAVDAELLGTTGPHHPSSFVVTESRLWACDFHDGSVWARENEAWQQICTGLRNPGSLTLGEDGSVYVGEFGADSVCRLLP